MKMIVESIRLAFMSLWYNRGRTVLSMLGIIIGVASVVIITSIGASASSSVREQIESVGLNTISVFPGRGVRSAARIANFELGDRILNRFSDIESVLPTQRSNATVNFGKNSSDVTVMGVSAEFASVFSYSASYGSFFSESDYEKRKKVVVLGADVAEDLFPDGDAVGKYVRLFRDVPVRLRVVGVMESRSDTIGVSFDSSVFVPYSTYVSSIENTDIVGMYIVYVNDGADVVELASELEDFLAEVAGDNSEAFRVISPATIADMYSQVTDTLSLLLGGVAAISLVVGGIGIMNIMLVSVTERTREIGIRKAMGASPFYIRLQFLIEAVVLTVMGGAIGICFGLLLSWMITVFFSWGFFVNWFALLAAFVFAFIVGVFFGFYPAYKASRLDPVRALAFE